jgi:hypothetical protein
LQIPRFGFVAVAAAFLLGSAPAWALSIQLSEMTSEQEEIDDDTCGLALCGTPASVLDALVSFEIGEFDGGNAGDELRITVQNTSDYDISEVWFSLSSDFTGFSILSPSDSGADDGYDLITGATNVDGFGDFNLGLVVDMDVNLNDDLIENGETHVIILSFTCSGTCDEGDLVVNGSGKLVAAKFINGGAVFEEEEGGNDSAFGASGTDAVVPEPSLSWLIGVGLAGLFAARRRD